MAGRFCKPDLPFFGFATENPDRWTGRVELIESELLKPLHWRKPRVIALNWMGDLFHEKVPDEVIDRIVAVQALCWQHHFLSLTKRAKRQREYWATPGRPGRIADAVMATAISLRMKWTGICGPSAIAEGIAGGWRLPLTNLALGVSCEDRGHLDRLDDLRKTPAALRWVSAEPLLSDLGTINLDGIDWVVLGGESGPGARPCHPDWARSLRDQCQAAAVPFFFKQWGENIPESQFLAPYGGLREPVSDGRRFKVDGEPWLRVSKRAAGRLLDGREWLELPEMLR